MGQRCETVVDLVGRDDRRSDEVGAVLVAECVDANAINDLLKTLCFREQALVTANKDGIKISVDDESLQLQESVLLDVNQFKRYHVDDAGVDPFTIGLDEFCGCFNMLSGVSDVGTGGLTENNAASVSTIAVRQCKLVYIGQGHPLQVITEEDNGAITYCRIKTLEPQLFVEFELKLDKVWVEVTMMPEGLRKVFDDFASGAEFVEITVLRRPQSWYIPNDLLLMFTTKSEIQTVTNEFTIRAGDFLESVRFVAHRNDIDGYCHKYPINLIKKAAKALEVASKVFMRMDSIGVLYLQFRVEQTEGQSAFIEFFCISDKCIPALTMPK